MPDKCLECPVPSADTDGFIVFGPGGAPRSEGSGVSSPEGPFVREAPQTGHFILKGKVSASSPLPDVPEPGWAYEAAEAGTYGGVRATPGDLIWCAGVNPVRWAILQSDSGSAVSVEQILSSGTKIATVTVGGQATDLYCETGGGIQTLSGDFGCETREISPAVDEPAVLYATEMVFIDQTGFEMLEGGNVPSGHYSSAYSGSHQSSSFSTSVPSSAPYAIALSTGTSEYASGYNLKRDITIMDWPYGGAVAVFDLLAAGETGVKLAFLGGDATPYGDGTLDVYASFSANQDGSYTVSYSARKDAVTEDVLTAKIDGKDGSGAAVSSVDVSPLLNYIGGRIEEVPAGDSEMLPLVDYENPSGEPPFYFINPDNFAFLGSDESIYPSNGEISDGVQIISFSASSPEPESFVPRINYGNTSGMPTFVYAKMDSSTGMPARFSLETALADPLVLDEFDTSSNPPVPTGNTVSLVTERLAGDVLAYSFSLYSGSVSGETKKVLRLYPSCDNAIDLSGICPEGGSSIKAGTGLIMEDGEIRLAMRKSQQHTIQIPSQYNTPYTYIYGDEDDDYEYNPSPYVIDVSSFEEKPVSLYINLLASMLTPQEITTMKNDLKSVLVDAYWKSGVYNRIYVDIASTDWRSNSLMFYINVQKPAPIPEYPDEGVFDELESVKMVMLNTTGHVGNDIGTYFPKMQLVVYATYWG